MKILWFLCYLPDGDGDFGLTRIAIRHINKEYPDIKCQIVKIDTTQRLLNKERFNGLAEVVEELTMQPEDAKLIQANRVEEWDFPTLRNNAAKKLNEKINAGNFDSILREAEIVMISPVPLGYEFVENLQSRLDALDRSGKLNILKNIMPSYERLFYPWELSSQWWLKAKVNLESRPDHILNDIYDRFDIILAPDGKGYSMVEMLSGSAAATGDIENGTSESSSTSSNESSSASSNESSSASSNSAGDSNQQWTLEQSIQARPSATILHMGEPGGPDYEDDGYGDGENNYIHPMEKKHGMWLAPSESESEDIQASRLIAVKNKEFLRYLLGPGYSSSAEQSRDTVIFAKQWMATHRLAIGYFKSFDFLRLMIAAMVQLYAKDSKPLDIVINQLTRQEAETLNNQLREWLKNDTSFTWAVIYDTDSEKKLYEFNTNSGSADSVSRALRICVAKFDTDDHEFLIQLKRDGAGVSGPTTWSYVSGIDIPVIMEYLSHVKDAVDAYITHMQKLMRVEKGPPQEYYDHWQLIKKLHDKPGCLQKEFDKTVHRMVSGWGKLQSDANKQKLKTFFDELYASWNMATTLTNKIGKSIRPALPAPFADLYAGRSDSATAAVLLPGFSTCLENSGEPGDISLPATKRRKIFE